MDIEDEIRTVLQDREMAILLKDKEIQEKEPKFNRKNRELEVKDQLILEKDQMLRKMVGILREQGMSVEEITQSLSMAVETILPYFKNSSDSGRQCNKL